VALGQARQAGGLVNRLKAAGLMLSNGLTFARLYLMRTQPNALPAKFRLEPAY
jgi:hypothetical protein